MYRRMAPMLVAVSVVLALGGCDAPAEDATLSTDAPAAESAGAAGASDAETLLTPADVESVSGLSGLMVVPHDPAIGAGGDVNIADGSGRLVAMLVIEGPEAWDQWLTDGFTVNEPVVPAVGEESFIGPNPDVSATPYIFGFHQGETAVLIETYFDVNGETVLSIDELRALAEVVAGRL